MPSPSAASELSVPSTFFERARREAERYGDDSWIFLRELVQNSRDAEATTIRFEASQADGVETITCDDDGVGMTRADVSRYLLRLYASRKSETDPSADAAEGDGDQVGRFGVGFWSVLRFSPAVIRVESRSRGQALGLEVDCMGQTIREYVPERAHRGTRVELVRPARQGAEGGELRDKVASRLRKYASTVKGRRGQAPPRLVLAGEELNRQLSPRGFIGEKIRGRGFEGVIGLGERPVIRLYAHGLLVREVASLEELLPRRKASRASASPGLYPRAEINADGLEVLLDRQAVVEDHLLESIVATCDRRLAQLRRQLLDRLAPLPILRRLFLSVREPRRLVTVLGALVLVAVSATVGVLLVEGAQAAPVITARPVLDAPPRTRRIEDALAAGVGPVINSPEGAGGSRHPWDLKFWGPGEHTDGAPFIKIATAAAYDDEKGLVADASIALVGRYTFEEFADPEEEYEIEVGLGPSRERFVLPVPTGHRVVQDTVELDGKKVEKLGVTPHDEPVLLRLRKQGGHLRYVTTPATIAFEPPSVGALPGRLPRRLDRAVKRIRRAGTATSVDEKAEAVADWVEENIRYTTDAADAARFLAMDRDWAAKVMRLEAGDCDVMNGLNVLALRRMGIPARLGIGFVGDSGRVAPDLHAWTEFWDEGWYVIDASPPQFTPRAAAAASGVGSGASGGRTGPDAAPGAADLPDDDDGVGGELSGRPTPSVDGSSNLGQRAAQAALLLLLVLAFAALLAAGWMWLRARKRAKMEEDDDDKVAVALLEHFLNEGGLREGGAADPLHLRHRPFFRTLRGDRASLARVEALAQRGRLMAGKPGGALVDALARGVTVLDRTDGRVDRFLPRLPNVILLEDVERLAFVAAGHPALAEVEMVLRRVDPRVRVHGLRASKQISELALPLKDRARLQSLSSSEAARLEPRHLMVGLADPQIAQALSQWESHGGLARFRLLQRILDATTLYLDVKEGILAKAAMEAL